LQTLVLGRGGRPEPDAQPEEQHSLVEV